MLREAYKMVRFLDWFDIPLPDFMDNQWGEFLILLGIWTVIGLVVLVIVRPLLHSMFARTRSHVDDAILHIIEAPVLVLIFLYGVVSSLEVLDVIPTAVHERLLQIYTLSVSVIIVYLAYKVFRAVFIPLGTEYARRKHTRVDVSVLSAVDLIGGAAIIILGLFWVLSTVGINVTVFLAGLGVAGLVLAFAMQDTLSNFFSGLHLMVDQPFRVGDTLKIENEFMRVLKVGFRSTRLYNTFAHELVVMPNNMIANQMIINLTEPDKEYRVTVTVGVAYGSPVKKVKEILLEAATSQDEIVTNDPEKSVRVRFTDFGNSALEFKVLFFVKDVLEHWRVATAVREHIDRRFREEGITIPFPQRTVSFLGQRPGEELHVLSEPATKGQNVIAAAAD